MAKHRGCNIDIDIDEGDIDNGYVTIDLGKLLTDRFDTVDYIAEECFEYSGRTVVDTADWDDLNELVAEYECMESADEPKTLAHEIHCSRYDLASLIMEIGIPETLEAIERIKKIRGWI